MRERSYFDTLCIIELLQRLNQSPLSYTEHRFRITLSAIDLDVDVVVCDELPKSEIVPIDTTTGAPYLNCNVGLDSKDIESLQEGMYQLSVENEEPESGLRMDEILYFMHAADVGRPSSYANVVEELVSNGLITLSGDAYYLSEDGHALVDIIKAHEPGLINPYFTQALNVAVEHVANGTMNGEYAFNWLLSQCFCAVSKSTTI